MADVRLMAGSAVVVVAVLAPAEPGGNENVGGEGGGSLQVGGDLHLKQKL